ncbi:uncharacterized protein L969DRAFT_94833 [Mixia osmundae IAM 14324]|uniref:Uncharacterized protein n=1 Tax=Mixia osmundae (strain CBS 9802 / IAM 14324 / JCM 22182 / KY 12970) TaxID=764103 RepID=G7DYY7_MIXOS|nr:uncharacterized protein L969DRAFT_94833 [Mixia osmundae IAM 14324]KEI38628.1 hypothetical protein L969DRAFT_94833 [Mixia osmundae IAM 14324]GAA95797.1 hypothetical protein E5Q_02454 [Mixia osmundae IAM 14324]
MGIRTGVLLFASSFLLGAFFTHWSVDYKTLWTSKLLDSSVKSAHIYYHDLVRAPAWVSLILYGVSVLGLGSTLAKMVEMNQSTLLFDGASLFLQLTTLATYHFDIRNAFDLLPPLSAGSAASAALVGVLKELASAHTIIAVALTGVIGLQAGQFYADKVPPTVPQSTASSVPTSPVQPSTPNMPSSPRKRK